MLENEVLGNNVILVSLGVVLDGPLEFTIVKVAMQLYFKVLEKHEMGNNQHQ